MPKVTYVEYNGTPHEVDVPVGPRSCAARSTINVPGIDADCGGECACATCHVYVDAAWHGEDRPGGARLPGSQHAELCRPSRTP